MLPADAPISKRLELARTRRGVQVVSVLEGGATDGIPCRELRRGYWTEGMGIKCCGVPVSESSTVGSCDFG